MKEVRHTIKNMLEYLISIENTIYVTVLFFDHEVTKIVKQTKLNQIAYESIMSTVELISARGMTNIELAFNTIKDYYMEGCDNIHIFLTDGSPTAGEIRKDKLAEILDSTYEHNFLGFGTMHNEKLLYGITLGTNGNYYFVDSIENAGMVYGEVLNKILYRKYEKITFSSDVVEFYNYKNNSWNNKYTLGCAGSEDNFTVHFRMPWETTEEQFNCNVSFNEICDVSSISEVSAVSGAGSAASISSSSSRHTPLTSLQLKMPSYDCETEKEKKDRSLEVEKYYYRQLVLECLYEINNPCEQQTTALPLYLPPVSPSTSPSTSPSVSLYPIGSSPTNASLSPIPSSSIPSSTPPVIIIYFISVL